MFQATNAQNQQTHFSSDLLKQCRTLWQCSNNNATNTNVFQWLTWSFRVSFRRRRSSCRSLSGWLARAGPGCGATTAPCAPSAPSSSASTPSSPWTSGPGTAVKRCSIWVHLRLDCVTNEQISFGIHFIYDRFTKLCVPSDAERGKGKSRERVTAILTLGACDGRTIVRETRVKHLDYRQMLSKMWEW